MIIEVADTEYSHLYIYNNKMIMHRVFFNAKDFKTNEFSVYNDNFEKEGEISLIHKIEAMTEFQGDLIVAGGGVLSVVDKNFKVQKILEFPFVRVKEMLEFSEKLLFVTNLRKIIIYNKSLKKENKIKITHNIVTLTKYNEKLLIGCNNNTFLVYNDNFEKEGEIFLIHKIEAMTEFQGDLIVAGGGVLSVVDKNFKIKKTIKIKTDYIINMFSYKEVLLSFEYDKYYGLKLNVYSYNGKKIATKHINIYLYYDCFIVNNFYENEKIYIPNILKKNITLKTIKKIFYDYGKVLSEDDEVVAYYELDKKYWEIKDNVLTIKKDK